MTPESSPVLYIVALLLMFSWACGPQDPDPSSGQNTPIRFEEVAGEVGLKFTHQNGMIGQHYFVEMMGAGCAVFDYDNDGDLDVYAVQGHQLSEQALSQVPLGTFKDATGGDRLFRNDLNSSGQLQFTDVTPASGIVATGYGMGVAVGDIDNDGYPDLYVTNWGPNQLLRNNGDGTFSDWTAKSGTGHPGWGNSCAFTDINGDGLLDLFVANYVEYNATTFRTCYAASSAPDYCGPINFPAQADLLYLNQGDGHFQNISLASGIGTRSGKGLGVAVADFNGDHLPDFYVANDGEENFLWLNRGDATFSEEALMNGCSLNINGLPEAGMGVGVGDFDRDGDADIFVTHLDGETNTLYANNAGSFEDVTGSMGLATASLPYTAFGVGFLDADNDGFLDLFVANGSVTDDEKLLALNDPYPLHARNQLFHHGGHAYTDISARAGTAFELSAVSRGSAIADLDNDGDSDILVANNRGPLALYLNQEGSRQNWAGFVVLEGDPQRTAMGAVVSVHLSGTVLHFPVHNGGSYCSSGDTRILVGLGQQQAIERIKVTWPDATVEAWTGITINQYTALKKGEGDAPQ